MKRIENFNEFISENKIYEDFQLNVRHYWQIPIEDSEGYVFEIALWKLTKKYPSGSYFLMSETLHKEIKKCYVASIYNDNINNCFYVSVFNDDWIWRWFEPKSKNKFEGKIEITSKDKEQYNLEQAANKYNL